MGSPVSDGMCVDWDVPVPMDDGVTLRADVFSPSAAGHYPVLLSYGPYAKGLAFQDGYPSAWQRMVAEHPDVACGSSNRYQNWEVVDPEKWVPDGYVCVRVGPAARAARPASLIISRRARRAIFTRASNGLACRAGRTGTSA